MQIIALMRGKKLKKKAGSKFKQKSIECFDLNAAGNEPVYKSYSILLFWYSQVRFVN